MPKYIAEDVGTQEYYAEFVAIGKPDPKLHEYYKPTHTVKPEILVFGGMDNPLVAKILAALNEETA